MLDKVLYTTQAVSTGDGRNGHVTSAGKRVDLDLAMPPELGGSGEGANPEQLFAAAYAACFHSALRMVARSEQVNLTGSAVTAEVGIGTRGKAFGLAVTLTVDVPGLAPEQARKLTEAAHEVCPYSVATRGNVDVELQVS